MGGFIFFAIYGFYEHFYRLKLDIHVYIGTILAFSCFYCYYLVCKVAPGEITRQNLNFYSNKYKNFYDEILYFSKNKCTTCNFQKYFKNLII